MKKVIFTVGLPGSGKTKYAKNFCEKNTNWVRVSRDDLRRMRGRYWLPKDEKLITALEQGSILTALSFGKNIIVDATNLNKQYVTNIKARIITDYKDVDFETKFFDVKVEECIKRDLQRENSVGKDVIMKMYNTYLKPVKETVKQDWFLPHVSLVDLDGTVALHKGRTPFQYDKCYTDILNLPVAKIVSNVLHKEGNRIVYMSGREASCKDMTIEWLTRHGLWTDNCEIHMRRINDYRKDTVIKEELFNEHVKDKYYVDFCLDDRACIVQLWRSMGLTCLQVAEGNF